jgi:hypothetical protein
VRSIDPRDDAAHGESVTNVIGQDEKGSVREPHHQAAHSSNPTKAGRPMRVARPVRVAGHRRAWISTEASSQRLQGLLERHVDASSPHRRLRPPSPTLFCPTSSSYQCSGLPWIATDSCRIHGRCLQVRAAYTAGSKGHHWVVGWALEVRFRGRSVLPRPRLELVPTLFVENQAATVKCGEATKDVCGVGSDRVRGRMVSVDIQQPSGHPTLCCNGHRIPLGVLESIRPLSEEWLQPFLSESGRSTRDGLRLNSIGRQGLHRATDSSSEDRRAQRFWDTP